MATRSPMNKQEVVIAKQIAVLRRKQEALRTKRRVPVIKEIVQQMQEFTITPEDIATAYGAGKPIKDGQIAIAGATGRRAAVAPKYRDPDTGETWTGRGKAPRWLAAAEASGASREQFLIEQSASGSVAP